MPRFTMPFAAAFDGNGRPMAGARLYFYIAGTTTPLSTYSDEALTVANTNPVVADASGTWPAIFLQDKAYKVVLKTSADATVWTADGVRGVSPAGLPVGAMTPFAGASAPAGWLLCYGQAVSRSTYAHLFEALGTTYGTGDGTATFNLPDLRGRSVFGKDNMGGSGASRVTSAVSGVDGTALGAVGGDQRMPQHSHKYSSIIVPGGNTQTNVQAGGQWWVNLDQDTGTAGSGASQNMPPAIVLNWIIYAGA